MLFVYLSEILHELHDACRHLFFSDRRIYTYIIIIGHSPYLFRILMVIFFPHFVHAVDPCCRLMFA